jgi:hypothetical protein
MKKLRVSFLIVALASVFMAQSVAATHWTDVQQVASTQSQACEGGIKIDDPVSGVAYDVIFTAFDNTTWPGTITFTITSSAAGPLLAFATDHPTHLVTSLLIKGGPDYANLYTYAPGVSSDSGLHATVNAKNNKYYGVSHVCVYLEKKAVA